MVDDEPNYQGYTPDQLLDASGHIDRAQYPERAGRLDNEIAQNSQNSSVNRPPDLALEFHGSAREYFRIWVVNLCLTLLTLGVFSAWAKVRKKRYLCSRTTLDGTPFQYLARPVPILKGRLIAAAGFLAYYISSHFVASLLPFVLGAGLIVAPWVVARSASFNARYTAFRNMTFRFDRGYLDTGKVLYMGGIIPVLAIGMMFEWPGKEILLGLAYLAFSLFFPWWMRGLEKFIVEGTSYGGKKGVFSATGGQFFGAYFASGLVGFAITVPLVVALTILFALVTNTSLVNTSLVDKSDQRILGYAMALAGYAGYVAGYAYLKARGGNLVWDSIRIGPLRFRSTLRWLELVELYVTNALGIVVSCGLLVPWAVVRTLRYRVHHMRILRTGDLEEFHGSDSGAVTAVGAEALSFFDLDLSL